MNVSLARKVVLAAGISAPTPAGDDSALSAERPFPGLRPFAFADRGFFFGREKQVFALYRLVENGRFIAVIGSSGSGKSSLVLAGLKGLLAEESGEPGGPSWICLDMRPGAAPLSRLAKTLARLAEQDCPDESARRRDAIEYRLRQSGFSFESALEEAGGLGGRTLLLIVDQFEELFRFGLAGLGLRRAGIEQNRARDEATQFVQILLDADRRRLKNVRVLITMRSDFVGDCAYFNGLSEAVSATQYLAPNLTRSQLEDVIRKPIEKAGVRIEPELVERLLNDCGDELDQLPVLQHCLMRLWDRAGAASAERPRRLTRQTYDDIGRMAESLSRHADEILRACAGKELVVEQTFRALSEVDREGRAIRRALRFDKLLAETGAAEADLRAVLDKFRAPTCSFLVPPPSTASIFAPEERVDIGHETLLRRWKRLAGRSGTVEAATGRPPEGWLAKEQTDGQRYRTLASLLEGGASGEMANLNDPERVKRWWDSLPRTPDWAERYGGRFEGVKKLIDDSIATKRRTTRNRRLVASLSVAGVLAAGAWLVLLQKQQQDKYATEQRHQQELIDRTAMNSAKTLLERVLDVGNNQSLDLAGSQSLVTVSKQFLTDIHASIKTSAAESLWAQSLNVASDLHAASAKHAEALSLARQARDVATPLTETNPADQERWQVLYDAVIRVGNALAAQQHVGDAIHEYEEAVRIAERIVSLGATDAGEHDLIDAHAKIGDIQRGRLQFAQALAEYQVALSLDERALKSFPESLKILSDRGKAYERIAETLTARAQSLEAGKSFDEARTAYQTAQLIRKVLVSENPDDPSLESDLAETHMNLAILERDSGHLDLALKNFREGVRLDEDLVKAAPGNIGWLGFLAPGYRSVAEVSERLSRPKDALLKSAWAGEALIYYRKHYEAQRDLSFHGRRDVQSRLDFIEAAKLFGDHSQGLEQIDAYRSAIRTWQRLIQNGEDAKWAGEHSAGVLRRASDDAVRFAKAFDDANDTPDAQTARNVAEKLAGRP